MVPPIRVLAVALAAAAILATFSGCLPVGAAGASAPLPSPSASLRSATYRHDLTVAGRDRSYLIHVPPGTGSRGTDGGKLPLVLALHGGGGNGDNTENQSGFSDLADREGFFVAYPEGTSQGNQLLTWNAGGCCSYAMENNVDDVGYISAVLDELTGHYPVDPDRIYVTGMSNGAMMTYRLGCELAGRIAAIAPVAGALHADPCQPTRPVPVFVVHGTADQNVPFEGGVGTGRRVPGETDRVDPSVAYAIDFWTSHDGCPEQPTTTVAGAVVRTSYGPCEAGSEVVLVAIEGGEHEWPGSLDRGRPDDSPSDFNATAEVWEFFSQHRLSG